MIRVFLADGHEVARRGVAPMLSADPQIRVVGEAGSADQARRRALAVRREVAGAPLCEHRRAALPGLRCLVLGQDDSPDSVYAAAGPARLGTSSRTCTARSWWTPCSGSPPAR